MSKSERLLALLQALRAYRRPVSAERLADELSVSIRTIYRDEPGNLKGEAELAKQLPA